MSRLRLRPGESILIHGGVGHFAVQFAKAAGACVLELGGEPRHAHGRTAAAALRMPSLVDEQPASAPPAGDGA